MISHGSCEDIFASTKLYTFSMIYVGREASGRCESIMAPSAVAGSLLQAGIRWDGPHAVHQCRDLVQHCQRTL